MDPHRDSSEHFWKGSIQNNNRRMKVSGKKVIFHANVANKAMLYDDIIFSASMKVSCGCSSQTILKVSDVFSPYCK